MQILKIRILIMHFVNTDSRNSYHITGKNNTNTSTGTNNTLTATPAPIYLEAATKETYNTVFFIIKFLFYLVFIYILSNLHNFSLFYNNY